MTRLLSFSLLASAGVLGFSAVHHVAIDMDVAGRVPMANVLETVKNVRRAFGAEPVEIEVVCHGPGLDLVIAQGNSLTQRIKMFQSQGVVFAACANTMKGRHVTKGQLVPGAVVVDAGAAELIRKQESGWAYLKSG